MPYSRRPALPYADRRIEWWFAIVTFGFGLWIARPEESMDSLAFAALRRVLGEEGWAMVFAITGTLHCAALGINGRRWWTPLVRTGMVVINAFVYVSFGYGIYRIDPASTGVYTYCAAMGLAANICLWGAVKDSHHAIGVKFGAAQ